MRTCCASRTRRPGRRPPCRRRSPSFTPCSALMRVGIGDGGDQRVGQALLDDFLQQPRGIAGAIAVIGQDHGVRSRRTACLANATPSGMVCTLVECSSCSRCRQAKLRHVVGDMLRQGRIVVGDHLDGHAGIRHVGPGKAEIYIYIDVRLAGLPGQRALHQVHPRRCAGPLHHGRRDDRHLLRGMRWACSWPLIARISMRAARWPCRWLS